MAVGSNIRALRKGKQQIDITQAERKILIPLDDITIKKAKACEEMIMFEKGT